MAHEDLKLEALLEDQGMSSDEFLQEFALESIVPGICMNPDCDATYDYEPDQNRGWCDECETNTVRSGLLLLGVI